MHSKRAQDKQVEDMNIEEYTGKRKFDSIVNRLTSSPNGNKITTTAGFMLVQMMVKLWMKTYLKMQASPKIVNCQSIFKPLSQA